MNTLKSCVSAVSHFICAIPMFARRTHLISEITGADVIDISVASSKLGVNLVQLVQSLQVIIKPPNSCGVCKSQKGEYVEAGRCALYDHQGRKEALLFHFKCASCQALCGPTNCALNSEIATHVVSKHILDADYFVLLRKPHARQDQIIAYARDLLKELEYDMATVKTIEAFTLRYNLMLESGQIPLSENTFRNAYFLCRSLEIGHALTHWGNRPQTPWYSLNANKEEIVNSNDIWRILQSRNQRTLLRNGPRMTLKNVVLRSIDCVYLMVTANCIQNAARTEMGQAYSIAR